MVTDHDMALPSTARRSDAGGTRFTARDVTGLVLAGDMYAAPYDLLDDVLGVRPDRLRAIVARWRRAGLAESGRIGPGPGWCWLTTAGMRAAALRFPARRPPLARLAHIRAVLAVRLSLESSEMYAAGSGWWRSERRIRSAAARAQPRSRPGRRGHLARHARQRASRSVLGGRGRADAQGHRPHGRDHAGPARQDGRVGAGRGTRPAAAL
jgi:hypothetical protein